MPKPYSIDLRERAVEAVESGASRREVAEMFKLGVSSVIPCCRRWRHQTAAVSSYDCTFDDLELVHQSLRMLEPPHTRKFPRVNAQDCKLGPIQPWDVKDFLRPGRGRGEVSIVLQNLLHLQRVETHAERILVLLATKYPEVWNGSPT